MGPSEIVPKPCDIGCGLAMALLEFGMPAAAMPARAGLAHDGDALALPFAQPVEAAEVEEEDEEEEFGRVQRRQQCRWVDAMTPPGSDVAKSHVSRNPTYVFRAAAW
jgi:hypothetical protein